MNARLLAPCAPCIAANSHSDHDVCAGTPQLPCICGCLISSQVCHVARAFIVSIPGRGPAITV